MDLFEKKNRARKLIKKIDNRANQILLYKSQVKYLSHINDMKFKGYFETFEAYELLKQFEDYEKIEKKS